MSCEKLVIVVVVVAACFALVSCTSTCNAPFSWTIASKNVMSCCVPFNETVGSVNATYYSPSGDKFSVTMFQGSYCGDEGATLCDNQHHNDQLHESCWNIANKAPSSPLSITWQVSCDQTFGKCKVEVSQIGVSEESICGQNKC